MTNEAFLPSTIGMICLTYAFSLSLDSKMDRREIWSIIGLTCLAGIWGWPFCLAFGGIYIIQKFANSLLFAHFPTMVLGAIFALAATSIPIYLIDSVFYQQPSFAPLNLLIYNVFSGNDRGPDLYGVEPWWFYFANGLLNFNVCYLLAVISWPTIILYGLFQKSKLLSKLFWDLCPFYLWLSIFLSQPHKEERFMFVVFPMICFNASMAFNALLDIVSRVCLSLSSLRVLHIYSSSIEVGIGNS